MPDTMKRRLSRLPLDLALDSPFPHPFTGLSFTQSLTLSLPHIHTYIYVRPYAHYVCPRSWSSYAQSQEYQNAEGVEILPERYRLTQRPTYLKTMTAHEHSKYNDTGLWPGWDYSQSMPSAHVPAVVMMLYFVAEAKSALLQAQADSKLFSSKTIEQAPPLSTELGMLFHQIDSLSENGLVYAGDGLQPCVSAFVPTNFLTTFTTLQEAEQLALLDDNPAVVDKARRPEAFYRFLLYHLDKEFAKASNGETQPFDSVHGISFLSAHEFVTGKGPQSVSSTRAMTVDLSYEPFTDKSRKDVVPKPRFAQVLLHALCKETYLSAWCKATQAYESVVQRRHATSLPKVLCLSCGCAGKKQDEGLIVWRTEDYGHWLPEVIEIEVDGNGGVVVRQEEDLTEEQKRWVDFRSKSKITRPTRGKKSQSKQKRRYQLQSVLSFIPSNDSAATASVSMDEDSAERAQVNGHHVLHVRVTNEQKQNVLKAQLDRAKSFSAALSGIEAPASSDHLPTMTIASRTKPSTIQDRIRLAKDKVGGAMSNNDEMDWVLFNGFVVSSTEISDARAFHVGFKEPCLATFHAIDDSKDVSPEKTHTTNQPGRSTVSSNVMFSRSISSGKPSIFTVKNAGGKHCQVFVHVDGKVKMQDALCLDRRGFILPPFGCC